MAHLPSGRATGADGSHWVYEYDARGRRIRRQVFPWGSTDYSATATSDQRFVYDGWNLVGVFDGSLNLQTAYMWGLDLSGTAQGAGGVGGLLAAITGTTAQFAAYDGNGNVRALADGGTGAWSAQYEYGPFGELVRATGPQAKANPFRFSTKWHDDDTDLLYYGYRYYQPATGRWISRDPIEERGGLNLYGFVINQPSGLYDVLGLSHKILRGTGVFICFSRGKTDRPYDHAWLEGNSVANGSAGFYPKHGAGKEDTKGPGRIVSPDDSYSKHGNKECIEIKLNLCVQSMARFRACISRETQRQEACSLNYYWKDYNCAHWAENVFRSCLRESVLVHK